jgi:hypothetical protein
MKKKIHISEKELSELIRESMGKEPLMLSFGPSGVFTNEKTPEWCLEYLVRMRMPTNECGEGI